jgi:putative phage-type endonuclease
MGAFEGYTEDVLRAIADHCERGGILQGSSPLVLAAREALSTPTTRGHAAAPLAARSEMSAEERDQRRQTLGSSEIASVCGVNPYDSVHSVWLSKCRGVDFEGNEATRLGKLLEPVILDIYADRYEHAVSRGAYVRHPTEPWAACTPDAYVDGGEGMVEAKLVGLRSIYMWGAGNTDEQESDAVPLHYLCQAQWQMWVTGRSWCDVAALLGTEYRTYRIRANPGVQAQLAARGKAFWTQHVVANTPPPIDGSEGAREMLKQLYPRSGADRVAADPEMEDLVAKLLAARQSLERIESEKQLRENEIKSRLKDARGAYGDGWTIRYAETKAGKRPFVFEAERKGQAA